MMTHTPRAARDGAKPCLRTFGPPTEMTRRGNNKARPGLTVTHYLTICAHLLALSLPGTVDLSIVLRN